MAMIGEKNHRHSANNPYSQFRDIYSLNDIKESKMIYEPLTKLMCSPTSDGAAAAGRHAGVSATLLLLRWRRRQAMPRVFGVQVGFLDPRLRLRTQQTWLRRFFRAR